MPANPNIFTPPEITDGFKTLERHVVEQLTAIDISELDHHSVYTHLAVGSNQLTDYYDGILHRYRQWGQVAGETRKPQPVASLGEDTKGGLTAALGMITGTLSESTRPRELTTKPFLKKEQKVFGLSLRLGNLLVSYSEDTESITIDSERNMIHGDWVDETAWQPDEQNGIFQVVHNPLHTYIAFGEAAITSLPEFYQFAAAYERLVSDPQFARALI